MLQMHSTKNGAGVTLCGDYHDLYDLYETVHEVSNAMPQGTSEFFLGFAYDIRHAYMGNRKIVKSENPLELKNSYYGVDILWPVYLSQIILLRRYASFMPTNKTIQANIYRIEAVTELALNDFNSKSADNCIEWLNTANPFHATYLFEFVTVLTRNFLMNAKTSSTRVRQLPGVLRQLNWFSEEYKLFESDMLTVAESKEVSPEDLHDESEWPEFSW